MNKPKFTIIIPTRERAKTLIWALKTCVAQDYDSLEIIVSDNLSKDNTREVVESFQDKRIRYINTHKRLNMTDNWEFALSHATGEYVTIIGDDDGLLPNMAEETSAIINDWKNPDALTWTKSIYHWDDCSNESKRNLLRVPLGKRLSIKSSKHELSKLSSFVEYDAYVLPSIYNSFVKHAIIKRVVEKAGQFFSSFTPDIYSGFAVAAVTEEYLYSEKPFGIAGMSSFSNGAALLEINGNKKVIEMSLAEQPTPFHPRLVLCPSLPFYNTESILQAIDRNLLPTDYSVSMKDTIVAALTFVKISPPKVYNEVVEAIKETARRNDLEAWANKIISEHPNRPVAEKAVPSIFYDAWGSSLYLKMNPSEIRNVYDASIFIQQIIRLNDFGLIGGSRYEHKIIQLLSKINKRLPSNVRTQMRERFLPMLRRAGVIRT